MGRFLFQGNIAHTIDAKGRVAMPIAFRENLGEKFTVGLNNDFRTVGIYPREYWQSLEEQMSRVPVTDLEGMEYTRLLNGNAFVDMDLDMQGRLLVPPTLRTFAKLNKNIRFVGVGSYIEIWDEETYLSNNSISITNRKELLEHVNRIYFSGPSDIIEGGR